MNFFILGWTDSTKYRSGVPGGLHGVSESQCNRRHIHDEKINEQLRIKKKTKINMTFFIVLGWFDSTKYRPGVPGCLHGVSESQWNRRHLNDDGKNYFYIFKKKTKN